MRANRRTGTNLMRWAFIGIGVGILASTGICTANPVSDATGQALNELPFAVIKGATPAQESSLVALWARFGLDQPGLYHRATRDLLDTHFTQLKKYMLECQRPGRGLDRGIQARFRTQGNAEDRDAMCSNLREWLRTPDEDFQQSVNVIALPEFIAKARAGARAMVADMLADWGDSTSLRAIVSEASSPQSSRVAAQAALDRMRHPAGYGFIYPDGHGGILFTRGRADLVSMTLHHPRATPDCPDTLEASRIDALWDLLRRCREGKHADWFNDGYGLHLVFRDGLIAELRPTESGWIQYSDNISGLFRGRVVMEAPALYDAIKECLPERPLLH